MDPKTNEEIEIECAHRGKVFPCEVYASDDEWARAQALATTKAAPTLRVARYCAWCGETFMVEVPVPEDSEQMSVEVFGLTKPLMSEVPRKGSPTGCRNHATRWITF